MYNRASEIITYTVDDGFTISISKVNLADVQTKITQIWLCF